MSSISEHYKISVRLMTYMHESYIKDAMDGIMMQNVNFKVEVDVGDDFSTDKTLRIIKSYQSTGHFKIKILDRKLGDSYCPIIFNSEEILMATQKTLEAHSVFCRRYFYPTLNNLDYLEKTHETPIADDISKRIICLPLYHDLSTDEQDLIINIIKKQHNS